MTLTYLKETPAIHVKQGLILPYESSGQQLGETRTAMAKRLMQDVEDCINKYKDKDQFYILVHGKPFPNHPGMIKIKIMPMSAKPPMMLSCMCFGVDNKAGKLTMCWSLPGNWPTYTMEGKNEPIPEVIGSINELGLTYDLDKLLEY
jgi:hypothetical protein